MSPQPVSSETVRTYAFQALGAVLDHMRSQLRFDNSYTSSNAKRDQIARAQERLWIVCHSDPSEGTFA